MKKRILFLAAIVLFVGCKAQSPKLEAPVTPYAEAEVSADAQKIDVTPKADILFIVDYSQSMKPHQDLLAANIQKFVEEFKKNKMVDFHVGVLPIYDTCHFDPQGVCKHKTKANYPMGELLPLKNAKREVLTDGPRFLIMDNPSFTEILANTIMIGEEPGPAYEELFYPVLPALSVELAKGPNKDFYRKDAHLILVWISDGDDQSRDPKLNPDDFARSLYELKDNDTYKLHTVGVLSPSGEKCSKDQNALGGPKKMENFLKITNGQTLSLCDKNFGETLAKIGHNLSAKIGGQTISLKGIPDLSEGRDFEVLYGSQVLPVAKGPGFDNGWFYDRNNSQIIIGPNTELDRSQADKHIFIKFTPITAENAVSGKVKPAQ